MSIRVRVSESSDLMIIETYNDRIMLDREEVIQLMEEIAENIGKMGVDMKAGEK